VCFVVKFFLKKVRFSLNIQTKFGIIIISTEVAEDEGPVAHEKLGRARQISLYVLVHSF